MELSNKHIPFENTKHLPPFSISLQTSCTELLLEICVVSMQLYVPSVAPLLLLWEAVACSRVGELFLGGSGGGTTPVGVALRRIRCGLFPGDIIGLTDV